MARRSALKIAAKAAHGFGVFRCKECANQIEKALRAKGFHGRRVEIRGAAGREYMVCFSYKGGLAAITKTGWHMGIRVQDMMFDNLHPDGMPYEQWLKDFDAPGGIEILSDTPF
ncbi:MAG TPA: papain fold toxin domain-containing protein [Gemmataceae bacterium]|jgi:hypothetical protein|nr:papain fold toxin domain-containing protein [Gemmataceae bacterium]